MDMRVTIAIDVGTTYSGLAVRVSIPQLQYSEFLDLGNLGGKHPTEVTFDFERWGIQCQDHLETTFQWIKLLLPDAAQLGCTITSSAVYGKASRKLHSSDMQASHVIRMYLEKFWEEAFPYYTKALGDLNIPGQQDPAKPPSVTDVVFTHPVSWEVGEIELLRRAISESPLPRPSRSNGMLALPEPVAAVYYLLTQLGHHPPVKLGQVLVVCDVGGGTIDTACCKVKSLNPLQLESAEVDQFGVYGGGTVLDQGFEFWLREELRKEQGPYPMPPNRTPLVVTDGEIREFMRDKWEKIKVGHHHMERGPHTLELPRKWPNKRTSSIQLSRSDLNSIFEPVVQAVCQLVVDSVRLAADNGQRPSHIFLCGGVGCNLYVQARVGDHLDKRGFRHIKFHHWPPHKLEIRNAIANGAALYASLRPPDVQERC